MPIISSGNLIGCQGDLCALIFCDVIISSGNLIGCQGTSNGANSPSPIISSGNLIGCQGHMSSSESLLEIISSGNLIGCQGAGGGFLTRERNYIIREFDRVPRLENWTDTKAHLEKLVALKPIVSAGEMNGCQTIIPPSPIKQCIIMNQRCFPTSQRERYTCGFCGLPIRMGARRRS